MTNRLEGVCSNRGQFFQFNALSRTRTAVRTVVSTGNETSMSVIFLEISPPSWRAAGTCRSHSPDRQRRCNAMKACRRADRLLQWWTDIQFIQQWDDHFLLEAQANGRGETS
jgi:hypothetical protein